MERNVGKLLISRFLVETVKSFSSSELFKLHHVACKCTRFIGENILNLAKFFVKITRLSQHCAELTNKALKQMTQAILMWVAAPVFRSKHE